VTKVILTADHNCILEVIK